MNWIDINKEKPQEGVIQFFKVTHPNTDREEKLTAYYCSYKAKEWLAIPFAGEEIDLTEFTSCVWLKEK